MGPRTPVVGYGDWLASCGFAVVDTQVMGFLSRLLILAGVPLGVLKSNLRPLFDLAAKLFSSAESVAVARADRSPVARRDGCQ